MEERFKYAGETEWVDEIYRPEDDDSLGSRPDDYCVVIDMETGIAYTGTFRNGVLAMQVEDFVENVP